MSTIGFYLRERCPACDGTALTELFSRAYTDRELQTALEQFYSSVGHLDYQRLEGNRFELARCDQCALVFQKSVPNASLLEELYESWIDPEKAFARYHVAVSPGRRLQIARDVFIGLSLAALGEGARALDYGCGWGEWGMMVAAFGVDSWGTELSSSRRAHCMKRGITVVDDAALPDGAFDLINADQVFEHLPHPRHTLQTLAAKLKRSGVIRIAVPNGTGIERRIRNFDREIRKPRLGGLNPVAPLEHLNCFRTRSLVALAASCGLRRVRPPWRVLLATMHFPHRWRARLKAVAMPFYLRSSLSTQLFFSP